jgi:hypothetical protein
MFTPAKNYSWLLTYFYLFAATELYVPKNPSSQQIVFREFDRKKSLLCAVSSKRAG